MHLENNCWFLIFSSRHCWQRHVDLPPGRICRSLRPQMLAPGDSGLAAPAWTAARVWTAAPVALAPDCRLDAPGFPLSTGAGAGYHQQPVWHIPDRALDGLWLRLLAAANSRCRDDCCLRFRHWRACYSPACRHCFHPDGCCYCRCPVCYSRHSRHYCSRRGDCYCCCRCPACCSRCCSHYRDGCYCCYCCRSRVCCIRCSRSAG